jgi:hypothetical protein
MSRRSRRTTVGVIVLVLVVASAGWTWGRPWWQERSLVNALEDVAGVASVEQAPGGVSSGDHGYVLELSDDVTARELSRGVRAVSRVVDTHRIAGQRSDVQVRADGFTLEHTDRYPLPAQVARAVVALRELDGVTGIAAGSSAMHMSVRSEADLVPVGEKVLGALAGPAFDMAVSPSATRLQIAVDGGGPYIRAQLDDVEGQLRLLRQVSAAAKAAGVRPARAEDVDSSLQFYPGTLSDGPGCSVRLRAERGADLAAVARTLIGTGPSCITLIADGGPTLRLGGPRSDPGPVLALRDRLRRTGAELLEADTSLTTVKVRTDDARSLRGLLRITRDDAAWNVADVTSLEVRGPGLVIFDGGDVSALHRDGTVLADLLEAEFLAYLRAPDEGPPTIGVSDGVDGGPDLTTDEGRAVLADTLRGSGFKGSRRFSVEVDGEPGRLVFRSTAAGEARGVEKPEDSTPWAYELVEAWNASAR